MATLQDLGVSAAINISITFLFLIGFAFLKLQPVNDRVYYPKWYIKGLRKGGTKGDRRSLDKLVNLDYKQYLYFLDWMREALRMPESELIEHAGLDSAVYLRIYLLGLKIFLPLMILGFAVLVPVNVTDNYLVSSASQVISTNIDKISMANVKNGSQRLWVHLSMTYVFTAWTCFMLYIEYKTVAGMRFRFLATEHRRPDQFTVLVRQIPPDPDESISLHVEHFFRVNHPDYYLSHQVVYNANKLAKIVKKREAVQNWLDYSQLKYARNPSVRPTRRAAAERERVLGDEKAIMPVAFVSFRRRWGAAVCAQTQQSKNPTLWLTEWAPEPRDVYWYNLAIPYVELTIRKLLITGAVFALIFFFIIPVTFVQSLANLDGIEKKAKFLKPIIERHFIKSFLQGFLPGLALKLFLHFLPVILMIMSKIEGHVCLSMLERVTAVKYYYFMVVNVFFASVLTGAAFEQLNAFFHQAASQIPKTLGDAIPMKATFFITFIMVDGWSGIAGDILRLKPLIIYHLKNMFLVKTEKDRENAMSPGSAGFDTVFPQVLLYFLLGTVYAIITPFILPFIIIYFGFAYVSYRHQVINVYDPEYESGAAFWPQIHNRIIASLIFEQITLLGVFSSKKAADSTPFLIGLPVLTIAFHIYCRNRFEPAFVKYPLEEAMAKDTLDKATHPDLNIKRFLQNAYMHPVFKIEEDDEEGNYALDAPEDEPALVPTKPHSHGNTPVVSVHEGDSPASAHGSPTYASSGSLIHH
ncbi:hypothetical protein O6H91_07G104400 [Diphasiastrum complanatum]|uniref:Uncharacterized protein n=1 Tax=Diphasiastrum complanatum TaxID=34168 RepID=A0ACC2D849_DIPCM|nr:hypothetical protein O6H91_07G104400 [Diphasiastrum complanatum]